MKHFLYLPFGQQAMNTYSSALAAKPVVPSDSTVLLPTRAIYVGGAGTLAVTMSDGTDVSFVGVTAGACLPISVSKVKTTGTTATSIVALY